MPEIYIADVAKVTHRLADELRSAAPQAISGRGLFSMALPGGSVATSCFPMLATLALPWQDMHFFWADERAVPASA